jgi:hypothetical protein
MFVFNIFKKQKKQKQEDYFDNNPENIIDDIEIENENILSEDDTINNEDFSIDPDLLSINSNSSIIPCYDNDPELLSINSNSSIIPCYDNDKESIYSDSTYHSYVNDSDEQYNETLELLLNCYDY